MSGELRLYKKKMEIQQLTAEIDQCVTPEHFVALSKAKLSAAGFVELKETEKWEKPIPQKFFVTRDEREIVAINMKDFSKGVIVAGQCDSPCIKAKPVSQDSKAGCILERIAPYGNMNFYTLRDRDLKVAGKVIFNKDGKVSQSLYETKMPIAIVPSLAIHMDRTLATSAACNMEIEMNPVLKLDKGEPQINKEHTDALVKAVADSISVDPKDIIDFDAAFVETQPTSIIGIDKSLVSGPNLAYVMPSLEAINALCAAKDPEQGLNCVAVYNYECIGGRLRCGCTSNFLQITLERIGCPAEFYPNATFIGVGACELPNPNTSSPTLPGNNGVIIKTSNCELKAFASEHQIKLNEKQFESSIKTIETRLPADLGITSCTVAIPVFSLRSPRQTGFIFDVLEEYKFILEILNNF